MNESSSGLVSCPFCGGPLIHSGRSGPRACSTCAICPSCRLVLTPDGKEDRACLGCAFSMRAAVSFGGVESDASGRGPREAKNKSLNKILVSLGRFFFGRSSPRARRGFDGRPRRRPSSRPVKSSA